MVKKKRRAKRKINDEASLSLPVEETQEITHEHRQQEETTNDDAVATTDVVIATGRSTTRAEANDDDANMKKLEAIMQNIFDNHVEHRFREAWIVWKRVALSVTMGFCKTFSNKESFAKDLKGLFQTLFADENILSNFVYMVYTECKNAALIVESNEFTNRVVSITHGLDQEFLGSFDMEELKKQVLTVFRWHEGDYKHYRSPSFAIVQSSGMGKTKLIQEYAHRQKGDVECMRILCMKSIQEDPPDFEKHYDNKLILGENAVLKEADVNEIRRQLNVFESACKKDKVVFFFDEAQMLCSNQSNAAYHTVLWWLRQDRDEQYVGVFAGTLLALSEFQVVHDPSGFSRDGKQTYKNYDSQPEKGDTEKKLLLYDPFYSLTTISLARADNRKDDFADELNDIRKYGWNGRPLFAAMLRRQAPGLPPALTLSEENVCDGVILNPTMYNILLRVLLSPNPTNWTSNDDSIASVLGTRIQLGLANHDFVNNATSRGYAMLVRYDTPRSDTQAQRKDFGSVAIVFPPDPVCAALAMGMMQPGWVLKQGTNGKSRIEGQEPKFWVENLARLLDQHSFIPNRGDSGEVFAALYMLLCGDVLRYKEDRYMRLFEVDLKEWLGEVDQGPPVEQGMSQYGKATKMQDIPTDNKSTAALDISGCHLTLNFIQVCRNYFRSHAWFGQSMLEYMYDTATGCYVYPQCPAIDIVFPIKQVQKDGKISYHPCLVSVKCWDLIECSDMVRALASMRAYVRKWRKKGNKATKALCLLLVIGTSSKGMPNKLPERKGVFPRDDTFISVVVPSNDKFEINKTIEDMAGASHISELLASHSFAYAETNEKALRVTATADYHKLGHSLLEDKKKLWKG